MGTATFRATLTNGQYKKGNFTDKDGSVYEGIHVFTTLNRRNQRIIPLVSTENEVELSSMNPNSNIAQPSDVIAKINGNVFVSNSCPVGFNYEGAGGNFYAGKWVYQAAPDLGSDNKSAYKNPKFSPSFCVKSNGDAIIRWFSSKEKLQIAMDACDCIIAGAHALVFDGKCVLDEEVYDAETDISIESQIDFCKYELKGGSCRVFKDKGYSGKNTDRPEFQKLLGEIRKGKVRRVIVYKLDRISRSILDFATMMELFQEYDVEFVSSTEKFDTSTPMGRATKRLNLFFRTDF